MNKSSYYTKFYSSHGDKIDDYWYDFTQIQFEWIIDQLKHRYDLDSPLNVIDLGCGTGRLLSMIGDTFPHATLQGVDGTQKLLDISRNRLGDRAQLSLMDLNNLKVLKGSYDAVTSTTVLHHLTDPHYFLNSVKELLGQNGMFYLSEFALETIRLKFAHQWWKLTQPAHNHAWTVNEFQNLLKNHHLNICNHALLRPDHFWQIQIYALNNKTG